MHIGALVCALFCPGTLYENACLFLKLRGCKVGVSVELALGESVANRATPSNFSNDQEETV